ncbi:hypothetical protein BKA61DRAFT_683304 [Leptodontidium sp. MPI-SDFR-AT-0119]|nr:hypothetical protein BKA61DRAFT_683304 [Leptodontidium sp. MPI-SDFR-AT-0119]
MDPKDQSWMQAIWNVDLDALKYDPDHQPPRFFIDQDAPLKSLAQLAHNFAWEKSRAVVVQGMERNNEETSGTDMDDLGFFEEGEDRTKSSTASENFHLTHRLLEKPQRSARHCFHSTTNPDDQNSSNVNDETRAIARCEGDDDCPSTFQNQSAVPTVALTKGELLKICKHFRYRTDKFEGLLNDSNEIRNIHLSLTDCAKLSQDHQSRGYKWVFKSPRNVDDLVHNNRMAAINNPKYESMSEDEGQYDSDYESDAVAVVGSGDIPQVVAGRDAPDFTMADADERHWIGGKTSWPTQHGTAAWNSNTTSELELKY